MRSSKRMLTLSARDYRQLLQYILEYRNTLIIESRCASIYNDLNIKLLHKAKLTQINCKGPSGECNPLGPSH